MEVKTKGKTQILESKMLKSKGLKLNICWLTFSQSQQGLMHKELGSGQHHISGRRSINDLLKTQAADVMTHGHKERTFCWHVVKNQRSLLGSLFSGCSFMAFDPAACLIWFVRPQIHHVLNSEECAKRLLRKLMFERHWTSESTKAWMKPCPSRLTWPT